MGKLKIVNIKTLASTVKHGDVFRRTGHKHLFMRTKPTGYLLNSSTVSDSLNAAKPLIVNLDTGILYFIKGDEEVRLIETAELAVLE